MKKVTHITYGLFLYRGIHFYRNLKDVVILIKRVCFLLKHGYTDLMLRREIKISLDRGGVDNVYYAVGFFVQNKVARDDFF